MPRVVSGTRQSFKCPIFGKVNKLPTNQLPTYQDVIKALLLEKYTIKQDTGRDESVVAISKSVMPEIISIYSRASIPVLTERRIIVMITNYHDKYRNIMKGHKTRSDQPNYLNKVQKFTENAKQLFDIAACKCYSETRCRCAKDRKIPVEERLFIEDQRTCRKMFIGEIDKEATIRMKKKISRQMSKPAHQEKSSNPNLLPSDSNQESCTADSCSSSISSHDSDYSPARTVIKRIKTSVEENDTPSKKIIEKPKISTLPSFAEACDRARISDRAAALIGSSIMEDMGLIDESDLSNVIDKNKVRRERQRRRKKLEQEDKSRPTVITSIYFDGRKDSTLTTAKIGENHHRMTVVEEHIAVLSEPNSNYLGHFSPASGSAKNILNGLIGFANDNSISLKEVVALGCDGTAVNTGNKGGVIRLFEEHLDASVHWFICQLHGNELPLRHLFAKLDGKTSGPRCYTGKIGKLLLECEKKPVSDFQRVKAQLLTVDNISDLSTDQKYLYEMHKAVSDGVVSKDLEAKRPGNLNHSRWLTTANRILRLYVSTKDPSSELKILTDYIMKSYVPMWFKIKSRSHVKYGAVHVFDQLHLLQQFGEFKEIISEVVKPVIQRNAYFAHPENILLSMIQDERDFVRELGWRRILKYRLQNQDNKLRYFQIPKLNFNAANYFDMIDWATESITEPPLTKHLTNEEVKKCVINKSHFELSHYLCHTQPVERAIKMITEASSTLCSQEAREGLIRANLYSRSRMPCFETKKQFVPVKK